MLTCGAAAGIRRTNPAQDEAGAQFQRWAISEVGKTGKNRGRLSTAQGLPNLNISDRRSSQKVRCSEIESVELLVVCFVLTLLFVSTASAVLFHRRTP